MCCTSGEHDLFQEYRIIRDTSAGWADIRLCLRNGCHVIYTLGYWFQDGVTSTVMDRHVFSYNRSREITLLSCFAYFQCSAAWIIQNSIAGAIVGHRENTQTFFKEFPEWQNYVAECKIILRSCLSIKEPEIVRLFLRSLLVERKRTGRCRVPLERDNIDVRWVQGVGSRHRGTTCSPPIGWVSSRFSSGDKCGWGQSRF